MDKQLVNELAYFVSLLSKRWGDKDLGLDDIRNNAVTSHILYGFVLVSVLGPGHSSLAEIRAALSKAWGSDIPPDEVFHPTCDSSAREFELFGADPKLIPTASPAATTGSVIASTVPTTSTFSNAAKDITAIEATTNPDDNTVFKASNPSEGCLDPHANLSIPVYEIYE
ncbi:hypothetical protein NW752_001801 [Fusarium irregulare]|uniref:Uncharacterized protein n=1 Tax=Fusarium irregulare TaxID=2494466 RepID=A0A9W8PTQ8_9HYPO|nr:hypothetical protein NW766_003965 [Fusarium irregulare]KAJ4026844.1 hypothetical protein NW752_001801 [Fusarium irregulare]